QLRDLHARAHLHQARPRRRCAPLGLRPRPRPRRPHRHPPRRSDPHFRVRIGRTQQLLAVFALVVSGAGHVLHSRLMTKRNRSRSAWRMAASAFLALLGAAYSHSQETFSVTLPDIDIGTLANRILLEAAKLD